MNPRTRPHVVLLRDSHILSDTRAKKMALSLSRLGFRVTVLCKSQDDDRHEATLSERCAIVRVPAVPVYADAAGNTRRRRRLWRVRLAPSPKNHPYLVGRTRLYRLRAKAIRGRGARASVADRVILAGERAHLAAWRRSNALRISLEQKINSWLRARWERFDERKKNETFAVSWRRELVSARVRDLEINLAPVLDQLAPDLIQAHDLAVLGIAVEAADRARIQGRNVRVVYDAIENWAGIPEEDRRTPRIHAGFMALEREFAPRVDGVITVSDPIADTLKRRYRLRHRPSVVLNVPVATPPPRETITTVREAIGLDPMIPLMVYSGGISEVRGLPALVQALKELPEVHLAIVAVPWPNPREEWLLELAESAGAQERLHLVPPVDPELVVPFLTTADIGIHPLAGGAENHEMALPNKLFEYAHAGLRLVVSNTRAMSEFVRTHRLGEVFEYGDALSLSAAVRRALETPREQYICGEEFSAWRATYSWQSQEAALADLYGRIAGSPLTIENAPFPALTETDGP